MACFLLKIAKMSKTRFTKTVLKPYGSDFLLILVTHHDLDCMSTPQFWVWLTTDPAWAVDARFLAIFQWCDLGRDLIPCLN